MIMLNSNNSHFDHIRKKTDLVSMINMAKGYIKISVETKTGSITNDSTDVLGKTVANLTERLHKVETENKELRAKLKENEKKKKYHCTYCKLVKDDQGIDRFVCKKIFSNKHELHSHKKKEHPSYTVCWKYKNDKCSMSSEECWYLHIDGDTNNVRQIINKTTSDNLGQVFQPTL